MEWLQVACSNNVLCLIMPHGDSILCSTMYKMVSQSLVLSWSTTALNAVT